MADSGRSKTITIGHDTAREGFAPWFIMGSGGIFQWDELHSNFLVSTDPQGALEARLAAGLPSLDDGTITVLPDRRMRAIWKIRPDVRWHDGAPFTADDVVFSWQVSSHPELPVQRGPVFLAVDTVEATDRFTAVITYKTTFYKALELGFRDFYLLPKHRLSDAFDGPKETFMQLPFWTTEYVHTGPFRLVQFEPGERLVLERNDDYFRGRPKIGSIVIRFIEDVNARLSNLLAEAVDAIVLPPQLAVRLRDEWRQSGGGFVMTQQGNWQFVSIQFHPEWGGPPELQRDVRARRGLAYGIDRDALREVLFPGFPDTEGDSFMSKSDPRASIVGGPFAGYRYDPARAARELAEAGWRRGPDGRMLSAAGQQVQLSLRTGSGSNLELSAVADNWRKLGIDVVEDIMSRAEQRDNEHIAKFPTMEITQQAKNDSVLRRFDSRAHPLPQNRYVGSNAGHYANPALDRIIDRLYETLGAREQGALLKEAADILAAELPVLPLLFRITTVLGLKHLRALDDVPGAEGPGTYSRNAHLWDRD